MLTLRDLCQVKDMMATVVQVEAELRRETGLNLNQSFALCCLNRGPLSAGALADSLRIHGASLSRVIKALSALGYLRQEPNADDSRQKVLSLTDSGRLVAIKLLQCEQSLFPIEVTERGIDEARPGSDHS